MRVRKREREEKKSPGGKASLRDFVLLLFLPVNLLNLFPNISEFMYFLASISN